MKANMDHVVPIADMEGGDDEDTALLRELHGEARRYLEGHAWCRGIKETWFADGIGGIVAVFLFRIDPAPGVDEWLWVVAGDLPSAYVVTDELPDAPAVLDTYCELMTDWVDAVRNKRDLETVYPVDAKPTLENAELLAARLEFLREKVIPAFSERLAAAQ